MFKEVIVEISKNCNLNCIMCGYGAKYNKPSHFMQFSLYEQILRELNGEYEVLRLNGRGESTIHPEFSRFVARARELYPQKRIRIFTNMNYRDAAVTQALAEGKCETMISLDSIQKEKLEEIRVGSHYDRIMQNIEALCQRSKLTALVFTLQPKNVDELEAVANFALDNRCHFFCNAVRNPEMEGAFHRIIEGEQVALKNVYERLDERFKRAGLMLNLPSQISGIEIAASSALATCADYAVCPNAGKDVCIYYDGTVTPCGMFNPYELGNVGEQPLSKIFEGDAFAKFLKAQPTDEYCRNCQYICK